MSDFVNITSANNWFKQHPEKIAGVEFETTSMFFPIQVKGTKDDVFRVTGVNDKKLTIEDILADDLVAGQIERDDEALKNGGWNRKDIESMANFVINNITIKVPVFRYKADGNTVINTQTQIEKLNGFVNIYFKEYSESEVLAILKFTYNKIDVYFEAGIYSKNQLKNTNQNDIDRVIEAKKTSLLDYENIRFVSRMDLEIAKFLNLDYLNLERIRAQFLSDKEKKKQAEIDDKRLQKEKIEADRQTKIKVDFLEFINNGKRISSDVVFELMALNNIKPHIRTIGSVNKRLVTFIYNKETNNLSYNYYSKTKNDSYKIQGDFFDLFSDLMKIYKTENNSESEKMKKLNLLKLKAKAVQIRLRLAADNGQLGVYVPTPKDQYFGASNSYYATREDNNFIEEKDLLKTLNSNSIVKSILGTKKITQDYLRKSIFSIYNEWHHKGDNFNKSYFYKKNQVFKDNLNSQLEKLCNEILIDIEKAKKPKVLTIKYFKGGSITVGEYTKSGRRFIYNETKFENVYYSKNSNGALEIITNGKLIFQDYNRKNTAIRIDGKEVTKVTFNKKLKESR